MFLRHFNNLTNPRCQKSIEDWPNFWIIFRMAEPPQGRGRSYSAEKWQVRDKSILTCQENTWISFLSVVTLTEFPGWPLHMVVPDSNETWFLSLPEINFLVANRKKKPATKDQGIDRNIFGVPKGRKELSLLLYYD